jgi:hypothetical protein
MQSANIPTFAKHASILYKTGTTMLVFFIRSSQKRPFSAVTLCEKERERERENAQKKRKGKKT